jgi:transcriptional antiterminator NusG
MTTKLDLNFENLTLKDEKNENIKWYFIQTQSNTEKSAISNIEAMVQLHKAEDKIKKIICPAIEVTEMKNGKKRESIKKLYPSYLMVFAEMNNDTFHIISKSGKVLKFLNQISQHSLPRPIPNNDVLNIFNKLKEYKQDTQNLLNVKVSDSVLILSGAFKDLKGFVTNIGDDNSTLSVSLQILGKDVDIKLGISDVEKVS